MKSETPKETVRRRTGGRSAKNREAVLRATLQALEEQGYSGLTISEIARRSGVHATSIQRRWGSLENVLLETIIGFTQQELPVPNTGSLHGDFLAFGRSMLRYLATPLGETVMRIITTASNDPAVAANRAKIVRARIEATRVMVERAVERGDANSEVDPELAVELLAAPINLRKLSGRPLTDKFVRQLVETLLRGLGKRDQ